MILENKNTTVAFRCPSCFKAVTSGVNMFRLTGDMLRLRCPECGEALTMSRSRDRAVRLTVPCVFCASPHHLRISESALFTDELFAFPCGFTGMDIFWAGGEKEVAEAVRKSDGELQALLNENEQNDLAALHRRGKVEDTPDPAVEHVVRFLLCELEEEDRISCYCREEGEIPLYDFQILSERVRVFCHCCGGEVYLPLRSEADAEHIIGVDRLELK